MKIGEANARQFRLHSLKILTILVGSILVSSCYVKRKGVAESMSGSAESAAVDDPSREFDPYPDEAISGVECVVEEVGAVDALEDWWEWSRKEPNNPGEWASRGRYQVGDSPWGNAGGFEVRKARTFEGLFRFDIALVPTWVDGHNLTLWAVPGAKDIKFIAAAIRCSDTTFPPSFISAATIKVEGRQRADGVIRSFEYEVLVQDVLKPTPNYRLRGGLKLEEGIALK